MENWLSRGHLRVLTHSRILSQESTEANQLARAQEKPPWSRWCDSAGRLMSKIPAITDFRARGTIMGPAGLTAVFGMGTGVAPPVWSPESRPAGGQARRPRCLRWSVTHAVDDRVHAHRARGTSPRSTLTRIVAVAVGESATAAIGSPRPVGAGGRSGWSSARLLGPVGCGGRPPCTPGLSTWSSSRSLRSNCCRKPRLGGGFALRCLQRLSCPDLATRRCPERDSRHTRGRSSPILSY